MELSKKTAVCGGRPSKLTRECRLVIIEALTNGASFSTAARQASISVRTLFRWKARGTQERAGIYHDFAENIGQVVANIHTPRNAVSPRQADLIALLERVVAATPWIDRSDVERELIQILMQRRVIPSR